MQAAPVVAVINTSEDVAKLLSEVLTAEGFRPVVAYVPDFREGRQDLATFLRAHEPTVMVWDIAIPYDVNWAYVQQVRAAGVMQDCPLVLTTTNKRALDHLVGPTPTHELIGRPFDLDEILGAVRRAQQEQA